MGNIAEDLGHLPGLVLLSADGETWNRVEDSALVEELFTVTADRGKLIAGGAAFRAASAGKAPIWVSPPDDVPIPEPTTPPATSSTSAGPAIVAEPITAGGWTRWPVDSEIFRGGEVGRGGENVGDVVDTDFGIVAGGSALWVSEDGIIWDRVDGLPDQMWVGALAANDQGVVAVGQQGALGEASVWFSPDGIEWTRSVPPGDHGVIDVVATDTGFVAVGDGGYDDVHILGGILTSPDGVTWTQVPYDPALFEDAIPDAIVATDHGLVAVGWHTGVGSYDPTGFPVWTSPDETTWTKHVVEHDHGVGLSDLTVGTPGLLAAGESTVWFSPDGVAWQEVFPPDPDSWSSGHLGTSVAPMGDGFVAVGDATVWISPDGITWTRETPEPGFFEGGFSTVRSAGPGLIAFSSIWRGGEGVEPGHWTWDN
jgi:hypothetical protein